jgi:hypothetical protein
MCHTKQFYDERELTVMAFKKELSEKLFLKVCTGVNYFRIVSCGTFWYWQCRTFGLYYQKVN